METPEEKLHETLRTLRWIIHRIEDEADRSHFRGERAAWKKAACECVDEAYGVLGLLGEDANEKPSSSD